MTKQHTPCDQVVFESVLFLLQWPLYKKPAKYSQEEVETWLFQRFYAIELLRVSWQPGIYFKLVVEILFLM